MYPFAILPDSILFLLDDLLSTNSQYASVLLVSPGLESTREMTRPIGLSWPPEYDPWPLRSCRLRQESLLAYLMREIFPKAILLATPACCATLEWKEGSRLSPSTSTSDAGELEALAGVALIGGLKPTFDTMMHLATKLVRTACNGSRSKNE